MAIPFVRKMDFAYGEPQRLTPLIRRTLSNNPGPFTFHGTGVYLIGNGEIAVIDPGPDMPGQLDMLLAAVGTEKVIAIPVTHGHGDHSPMAGPLSDKTGAKVYALPPRTQEGETGEERADPNFRCDVVLKDGDIIAGPGWTLEAVFTPGHTSNHMCFALKEENALFSGDHIMGWSTTGITPPDGDMDDYITNLEKIRARNFKTIYPTHGPPITDPGPFISELIAHRLERDAQVLTQLRAGKNNIADIVEVLYADVDRRLHPAARRSILAHMIRLVKRGQVATEGEPAIDGAYRLAS